MEEKLLNIEELIPDDKNMNKGTDAGRQLMEKSFSELGAGRSILLDKDNRIIAGNKSTEAAIATGIKKVRVIETTGDELIAVRRIDLELDSAEGRRMALADNATQQANLSWDETQLAAVADEIEGFDPSEWGVGVDMKETEKLSELKVTDVYYTPKEKPHLSLMNCIDTRLYNKKNECIEKSSLPPAIKKAMKILAYRFYRIDFENIANYYAFNATEEEKRLLERLRCVLVDCNLNGFIEDSIIDVKRHIKDTSNEPYIHSVLQETE